MPLLLLIAVLSAAPAAAQSPQPTWPRGAPASFVDLAYPPEALNARVTGTVVLRVTADPTGRVTGAERLNGPGLLAAAAIDNVRKWTLSPGVSTGAVVYLFEIDPGACNDDHQSLFRLAKPNLAVITACTRPGRANPYPWQWQSPEIMVESWGTPLYPPIAQAARISGVVVLELSVDDRGAVEVKPLTDLFILTDAAVAHAKTWKMHPGSGSRRGVFVYEFTLDHPYCPTQGQLAFIWVTADYRRLAACSPLIDVATAGADRR